MIKIAVDLMGGDLGPGPLIKGAIKFSKLYKNAYLYLVGVRSEMNKKINVDKLKFNGEIIECDTYIETHDSHLSFFRKKNNSMQIAMNLVKEKKADAVISAGNSGAYVGGSTIMLKTLKNLIRPVFMPIVPTVYNNNKVCLLDGGAFLEINSEILHQWSILGTIFSQIVLKKINPQVALLNIGTEESKGTKKYIEYHKYLKHKIDNFMGNIEARAVLEGKADIVLCDGFAGNILLKSIEGTASTISKLLKKSLLKTPFGIAGAILSFNIFRKIKKKLDYREVGGALVLGVNGIVVKAHGSTDQKALISGLKLAYSSVSSGILKKINDAI